MDELAPNSTASVVLHPTLDLVTTAQILTDLLCVNFQLAEPGTYDEFPAYVAQHEGRRFALLGIPAPEDALDVGPEIYELLVDPINPSQGGYIDATEFFERLIQEDGRLKVYPEES